MPSRESQMPRKKKQSATNAVREIRRQTRRKYRPEEEIRIVLAGKGHERGQDIGGEVVDYSDHDTVERLLGLAARAEAEAQA